MFIPEKISKSYLSTLIKGIVKKLWGMKKNRQNLFSNTKDQDLNSMFTFWINPIWISKTSCVFAVSWKSYLKTIFAW